LREEESTKPETARKSLADLVDPCIEKQIPLIYLFEP